MLAADCVKARAGRFCADEADLDAVETNSGKARVGGF